MTEEFMRRAIALALENVKSGRGGPFGALVVKDGKIIAEGTNLVTSTSDPTAHAEVVAIRAACRTMNGFQLAGCELYTSCEPCPMCLGAIYWSRPERVFYGATAADAAAAGFDDAFIYKELAHPPEQRRFLMHCVNCDDVLAPFRAWTASAARRHY
jgi:guanine deaminase